MLTSHHRFLVFIYCLLFNTGICHAIELESSQLTKVATLNSVPWAIENFANNRFLISLRSGKLLVLDSHLGSIKEVPGLPDIYVKGQGGLMDIKQAPSEDNTFYVTYAKPIGNGGAPTVAKVVINNDRISVWQDLFTSNFTVTSGRHFGSRVTFDQKGFLYMTIGDGGDRDNGQDTTTHAGTIVRLGKSGEIPNDNPYVNSSNVLPEIYSFGHRNPQGIAFDPHNNVLWAIEHGPRGGDELNKIEAGKNYGWPITSHGQEYWGPINVGEAQEKEGIESPKKVYVPSIAPGSLYIYTNDYFPRLQGKLLIGALKLTHINILDVNNHAQVIEERRYYSELNERIRDITSDDKGNIWFIADSGAVYMVSRK
ncbi:PQQ-dependent sugar dehydrogenase [Vibrio sp. ZSDZ34]|uniref:PQQ-dependent sugar dehydrogenase n=1 Tax=Vibrio gelatinilyticus TaxID=2893468 RepID=A0A9X2AZ74_9VIBR|nr:PQQ-dependent sugar dehydrogenase [Vibrio gelatinilyticus]MCJ2377278.1 PQQ-dependent sugar dehydrogenase [Vibrio gelatinilyticus]